MPYIEFKNVVKEYKMGEVTIKALNNTNFEIEKGELVVIVGPSGAGKTTTLNILGGMDTVTTGRVYVDGKNVSNLKGKDLIKYRRDDIGFVFQFYNLVPNLTALEKHKKRKEKDYDIKVYRRSVRKEAWKNAAAIIHSGFFSSREKMDFVLCLVMLYRPLWQVVHTIRGIK